jgi:hypothetical protein
MHRGGIEMEGKNWLWIAVGVLALVAFCCVGILIGGALAGWGRMAAQPTTGVVEQPPADLAQLDPTAQPTEQLSPTVPATPVPTQPPPPTLLLTTAPTATPFPTPRPPAASPEAAPAGNDLQALVRYANDMQPLLEEASRLLERDGKILEASEGGNDAALCDGRLESDNVAMVSVLRRARAISPPASAARIHEMVLLSGDAWTEALDNVEQFCDTGNPLFKIPAVLKFWEAAVTLQDAGNRFWLLLVAQGVEDWVQR